MTIKRFLLSQAIAGAVINAVLNGPPVLLVLTETTKWHLFKGFPSIALDTLGMAFGVSWGTGWILTTALRRQVAQGKIVLPRGLPEKVKADFGKWPASAFHRGINLSGLAVLACALPTIGVMVALGVSEWGPSTIVTFKTLFGLVMGAIFTPLTAIGVMVEEERRVQQPVVEPLLTEI
jgi:hypothetical protein